MDNKQKRKQKQWNNQFENNQIKNNQNQNDDEYKFNPNDMQFPEVNLVNIPNKQRSIIIKNFGNFHDNYSYKQHQKSIKNKLNYNKNKNRNRNKNNKNNNYHYKKWNARRHFR